MALIGFYCRIRLEVLKYSIAGVIPPGGGILVGGPNHHASQHHLHTSQLLIDGLVEPHNQYQLIQLNNGGNAISHSHTLPHSMSHHGKGLLFRLLGSIL